MLNRLTFINGLRSRWAELGKRRRRLFTHTAILLAIGIIFSLITLAQPFNDIQQSLSDRLFLPESANPNVVIAAIDDETFDVYEFGELGGLTIPREDHAKAIENLAQAGASVVTFDVVFTDESSGDSVLAAAMVEAGENGTVVIQPIVGNQYPSKQPEVTYQSFAQPNDTLQVSGIGHANVLPDTDDKVRRIPLLVYNATTGESYHSLHLASLHAHFYHEPASETYSIQDGSISIFERNIPVDDSGCMRINYVNKPGTFIASDISYLKVIEGDFDPDLVKNKIVLVGVTGTGSTDYWVTPISKEKMFGVEVHANAIDTMLGQRFLIETGEITSLLILLLLVGITSFPLPRLNLRWSGLLVAVLIVVYAVLVFISFDRGYILNIIYPPICLLILYVASISYRITTEQLDKREVGDLFGKYVSSQVASEIMRLSDAEKLSLGGEEREVTVFFTDIRGFTQLSEQMPPEAIVNMLNKYFSVIIDRILANEGMINKFAGDNIMAVWNAPQSQPDHALLAVRAAAESQQAIIEMQEREPDLPPVQFGFGINTGKAIAGNVGSVGRLEYTVIGDAVNLASRICGAAPGGQVWISDQTYEQVKGQFQFEELEPKYFKGKKEAVTVYQVELNIPETP